jgi:serine/threonine protein kinase
MTEPLRDDATLDERYSVCWAQSGPAHSAAAFLADHAGAPLTEQLEVLLLDQLLRWRSGCPKPVQDYLAEHPTLAGEPEARLKLVQGEFLARLEREEDPDPAVFIKMFPDLAEEIRAQCEVDRWLTLAAGSSSATSAPAETVDLEGTEAGGQDVPVPSSAATTSTGPGDFDAPLQESDFQLLRPLGAGGMGEVFEALQKSLRKRVAIKLIHREALDSPSRVRRFIAEARALGRLRHPRIVDVHGIGRMLDGRHFLVMDLIEGGTTLTALIKAGPVPFDRAATLVATIAEAIDHAHARGVAHRDLKPSNVLLDAEGNPNITDFGLAKILDQADPDHPPTTADQILGTPHYMSPEQADPARGPITPRTDVYGLGGILFALLTGKPPIQGESITHLLTQIVSPEPIRSPRELRPDVPPAVEQICRRCLHKQADQRYASAREVAESLKAWLVNPVEARGEQEAPVSLKPERPKVARGDWAADPSLKGDDRGRKEDRWKTAAASVRRPPRRLVLATASAGTLLVALAVAVQITVWQFTSPDELKHEFMPFFISEYQKPEVPSLPWAETNLQAIKQVRSSLSIDTGEKGGEPLTRKVMEVRLASLVRRKPKEVAVVYLACRAMVDGAGTVQLLGADSDPYARNTLLPLRYVLSAVKKCPSRNKLLVLDIMWSSAHPLDLGGTSDGVADLIRKELGREDDPEQLDDPHLMVLAACSPGEVALWSEPLGQSVFGHYFLGAFHDQEADADHDGTIAVKELASYVSTKVDDWARQHRGLRQRPVLIGSARDFPLAPLEPQRALAPPKDAPSETAGEKDAERRVYPQWLADGWGLYERWSKGDEVAAAPRVFRRLETSLLRSEQEWRSGLEPSDIQARLDEGLRKLSAEMGQALESPPREVRSVGQARAFGQGPDPALAKGFKEILERRRKPEPLVPPDQAKAQLDAAVQGFVATLKGKTRLDLATAIAEAAGDERFNPGTVQFLDTLVIDSLAGLDVVELRLLRQLARRAGTTRPDDWDDETAKTAWDTVLLAEEANNRPYALPWVRDLLDEADALRHEAEVLLLPEAAGFASRDQIARAWQRVQEAYTLIDGFQVKLRDARRMLSRARAALPALIPYLEATGRTEREFLWLQAAQTAHQLDVLLERPAMPARERLEPLRNGLSDITQKLDSQLDKLLQSFEPGAVRDLVAQCGVNQPRPAVAGEVEAILTTPFPPVPERIRLWEASLVIDRRLGELPVPTPASTPGAESRVDRTGALRELATRRANLLSALLGLAGIEAKADQLGGAAEPAAEARAPGRSTGADASSELAALSRTWGGLARDSRLVRAKLVDMASQTERPDDDDRPGWIAPAFALELRPNPIRQARDRDDLAARGWLAGHYRHQDLDLHRLVDPDKFYDAAALEYPQLDRASPEAALELGMAPGFPASLSLSGQNNRAQAAIRLVLGGAGDAGPQKVALKVLEPADPRLRVPEPPPAELELPRQAPRTVDFRVEWAEDGAIQEGPPPAGLIVQARLPNQRPYHLLVPLTIVPERIRPRLVLRAGPARFDDLPFDRFLLRTLPGRQNFFVFVKNPSPVARDLLVEVMAGTDVIAVTPKPIPVKGRSAVPVPGFGAPVLKPTDPLPEAPQGLKLRLRDPAADQVLDEQPLQPAIAAPLEYLEVIQPRFIPAQPGEPNRLEITLRALPQMTGPACRIKLIVPSDKDLFPAFREPPKGYLEGDLEPGGKDLHLYAEDIKLDPAAKEEGRFQVTVDGLQRALWYRTRFSAQGEPQPATIDRTPRVRFKPELVLKPGQAAKLRVQFTVDNAPPAVGLAFVLGQFKNGKWVDDLTPWGAEAKRRHLGFDPRGEGGALQFEASVEDWTKEFDIPQNRGRRRLQAYLLDPQGRRDPLDTWGMDMVLDDLPPQEAALEVPGEVEKGATHLPAKASVKPPPSGIKEVAFIVGSKADFAKVEAEGKAVGGKPKGDDRRDWEATLPLPKDASGKIIITARFTSGVGLTEFVSAEVAVREPPPPPPAAAASPAPEKPGAIEGKVTENDVAQPGQVVLLLDPKAKDKENPIKGQQKTAPNGTYSFPDLKPGPYRLYCVKQATNRRAIKDVTVESGKTARQDLELRLP